MGIHDIYDDEAIRCLKQAKEKFEEGFRIIDQAIFAKYIGIIHEQREENAKTN